MTAIDPRPSGANGEAAYTAASTRLERRAALDVSIDDELLRGELRGPSLPDAVRGTLSLLVEHELAGEEPLTEKAFLAAGPLIGTLSAARRRRRLEALVEMNLARRDADRVRPTVAGIAAVRPVSTAPADERPARELLRRLRRGEIDSIRR
ncbi:hypothetical protein [Microbacterium sp. XT11]|uniref:hypothetical protein n=1 Tax=Microbacterium sp. XT11 TaxID=367477 RepID=UPI00082E8FEE|nr:hypothetical protein [Microbacterium sp. XT11]